MVGSGQIFGSNRKTAQALSGRGENGVAHGRRHHRQSRLADSSRLFLAHHHVDFRLGRVFDARHLVVVKVGLLDAAILDGDGVMHSGGQAVDGGAFDLRADAIWIDGPSATHGINKTVHLYGAVLDADFGDSGGVGIERIKRGNTASLAFWQRLTPARFFGGELHNALETRVVERRCYIFAELRNFADATNELQAKGQWILARGSREFVNKAFHDEAAAGMFDGAPPRAGNAGFGKGVFDAEIRRRIRNRSAGAELAQP